VATTGLVLGGLSDTHAEAAVTGGGTTMTTAASVSGAVRARPADSNAAASGMARSQAARGSTAGRSGARSPTATRGPTEVRGSTVTRRPTASRSYTVVRGDSLWAIGRREGVEWRRIAELNRIEAPYLIYPGQRLALSTQPTTTEPVKAAATAVTRPASPGFLARALAFVATVGKGRADPYFGTASYYGLCGELAARIFGHNGSGFPSALAQWDAYVGTRLAHPGGRNPPPGSLLFWYTPTFGHVAVYVGEGLVVTNDVYDSRTGLHGGVYLAPVSDISRGVWRLPYLGWAPPVYR
jgi:LysM repeat protein